MRARRLLSNCWFRSRDRPRHGQGRRIRHSLNRNEGFENADRGDERGRMRCSGIAQQPPRLCRAGSQLQYVFGWSQDAGLMGPFEQTASRSPFIARWQPESSMPKNVQAPARFAGSHEDAQDQFAAGRTKTRRVARISGRKSYAASIFCSCFAHLPVSRPSRHWIPSRDCQQIHP